MLHGHNLFSSVEDSHAAPERLQQSRVHRSRRGRVPGWILVFLLCVSLCSLSLSCVIQYPPGQLPSSTPGPTPSPNLTPTPSPTPVTPAVVSSETDHYIGLILRNNPDAHHLAYSMLSPEQMRQLTFTTFEHDMNYTLLRGCWHVVQISAPTLEKDEVTWETGIELEYVPYGGSTVQTYYWHFQWRLEQRQLVIVAIGLYPTGVDPSASLPC